MRPKFLIAAGMAVVATTASACNAPDSTIRTPWAEPSASPSAPEAPGQPQQSAVDYSRLMLQASDISITPDTFTARDSKLNPNGQAGASALFVNADDTRAVANTVLIYPDQATASATLKQASAAVSTIVSGGTPQPAPVGTDGTTISGSAPDGSKAVTLLMFTQGRALVRLEFDSAQGDPTPPETVTSIGKMQLVALRIGLPERT